MCNAFDSLGIDIELALPRKEGFRDSNEYADTIEKTFGMNINFSISTYEISKLLNPFSQIQGVFGVQKILRKKRVDFCYTRNPVFLRPIIHSGFPVVFEIHNSILHNRYKLLDIYWTNHLLRLARHNKIIKIITISDALAKFWIRRGIFREMIFTWHDGFNPESFCNEKDPLFVRKQLGLPLNRKIMLYTGSLYEDRGIENILELARLFSEEYFVIVGGPEEDRKRYGNLVRRKNLSNVVFTGYVPHKKISDYLFAADILLMVWTKSVKTINYCSPLKMFEYMASGRPIVGNAFPTIKEVLRDGETAYLSTPDDLSSLIFTLNRALTDMRASKIGERAKAEAFEKYTWTRRAQEILNAIGEET
jgi:glycosyltransferase involved in cell wall biosynthesis